MAIENVISCELIDSDHLEANELLAVLRDTV